MSADGGRPAAEWLKLSAPTLAEMEAMALDAYARLPEAFRAMCGNLVVRVEDFPTDDVLEEMEAETPFDLLGLFQGIGLAQGYETAAGMLPNMIFLYRRPILDYWAEHEDTLGDVVTHVLVHEIGHHFGLSDEDMERLEEQADT
ncbi:putative Zn-dependent protease with MMP-like domain [Angulomicrobium tetraedrale]|uniref:Putative Zn-dependent protease with MMP-like domain n=1 Tax=Ancylobacter tetraedralis TaxID=217068 RepID=A0A839ZC17_9HYPH|nr:metallopeptidase family protein [Ancylobacter tetraedralis]MBB3772236.1 putative Zn-dependent protease with MMP-like domain [Ancylobacter tetraedralis]